DVEGCRDSNAILLGPSSHLAAQTLREELGLFANLRPVRVFRSLENLSSLKSEIVSDVDFMIVHERAVNTICYRDFEIDRVAELAFEVSRRRRKRLCSVDKANTLEVSQFWSQSVSEISKE